jgi:hypothetical protein
VRKTGNITVNISIVKTTLTLDATAIATVIAWVQANVKDKLPVDTSLTIRYEIIP